MYNIKTWKCSPLALVLKNAYIRYCDWSALIKVDQVLRVTVQVLKYFTGMIEAENQVLE
jgi:hypothetical protein